MNDMTTFEQQLASGLDQLAGPRRPVDAMAIPRSVTTTSSPKWRFQSMFSAAKFVVAGAIVALFGGFLLAGVLTQPSDEQLPAAVTDSPAPTMSDDLLPGVDLVTEEVEPGVFRVLGDTAGHDLVSEPPRRLVVAPDDSVWVGRGEADNDQRFITHLVELGQAGRIGLKGQRVEAYQLQDLAVDTEGRPWIIDAGRSVRVWEDGAWAPARWPNGSGRGDAIATTSDGSVWVARDVRDNPGPRVARIRDGRWEVLPTLGRAGDYPVGWFGFAPSPDGTVWLSCGSLGPVAPPCAAPLHFFDGEAWSTIMPVDQRLKEPSPAWITRGPDETIWAYFDGGPYSDGVAGYLARLRDGSWTAYDESDGVPVLVYNGGWISSQAVDPQGTLWVTMSLTGGLSPWAAGGSGLADPSDGVMSFDGATWRQYLRGVDVDQVAATSDGSIWVFGHPRERTAAAGAHDVRGDLYVITPEAVAATE